MIFTLDTSGVVEMPITTNILSMAGKVIPVRWSDLLPFEQGYVEAMFASCTYRGEGEHIITEHSPTRLWKIGFSDLASETLAAIRKDCAAITEALGCELDARDGRDIWNARAKRFPGGQLALYMRNRFPPLTVSLGDDGKVRSV